MDKPESRRSKNVRTNTRTGSMSVSGTGRQRAVQGCVRVIGDNIRRSASLEKGTRFTTLSMPPMSFLGVVTKAGFMNKTATVTVPRWVIDAKTGKVRHDHQHSLLPHNNSVCRPVLANSSVFPGARNSSSTMKEIVRANHYRLPPSRSHASLTPLFTFIELRVDDSVLIRNCPPISARKRFTLEKVVRSPETERDLAHAEAAAAPGTPNLLPSPTSTS